MITNLFYDVNDFVVGFEQVKYAGSHFVGGRIKEIIVNEKIIEPYYKISIDTIDQFNPYTNGLFLSQISEKLSDSDRREILIEFKSEYIIGDTVYFKSHRDSTYMSRCKVVDVFYVVQKEKYKTFYRLEVVGRKDNNFGGKFNVSSDDVLNETQFKTKLLEYKLSKI